jgi:hypothetical protein
MELPRQAQTMAMRPVAHPETRRPSAAGPVRPAPASAIPSRQSLRGAPAPAPAQAPAKVVEEEEEREIPGNVPDAGGLSWEERLGPVGITLGAILACVAAWLLTSKLF